MGRTTAARLLAALAIVASALTVLSGTAAAATATYYVTKEIPAPPASNYAGSAGGDGWDISLSTDEVFNVFHHNGQLQVACHKQVDASACYPVRVITDDSNAGFDTPSHSGTYLDVESGMLWVYATRDDGTPGVVCVDTTTADTDENPFCGFTALGSVGDFGIASIPTLIGDRLYAFNYVNGTPTGTRDTLMCFDVEAQAACAGQPFAIDFGAGDVSVGTFPVPATALIGDQIIIPINAGGTDRLACFDDSLQGECAGAFPIDTTMGLAFEKLDSSGVTTGFCLDTSGTPCFDLAGGSVATPAGLPAVFTQTTGWNGKTVVLGSRVYLANGNGDQIQCFDYSSGATCPNFPHATTGSSFIYTVNRDWQRPTCLWVNADGGASQIQNFDAYSGGACGEGPIRLLAAEFVSPAPECVPSSYTSLQVLEPGPDGYSDGEIAFRDQNGNAIAGADPRALDSTGTADLTGLDLDASGLPQFLITLNDPVGEVGSVTVEVTWTGEDDPDCVPELGGSTGGGTDGGSGGGGGGGGELPPGGTIVNVRVERQAGLNATDTAIELSEDDFDDAPIEGASAKSAYRAAAVDRIASSVVLATAGAFPDGLVGGPLAAAKDASLLLTGRDVLDPAVEAEITRILNPGATVYLLGGTAAIGEGVATRLAELGYEVVRYGGATRYETALQVATEGLGSPDTVLLATGADFPDSITAGAAAAKLGAAVILTAGEQVPSAVASYVASRATKYAIGGPASRAVPSATAIAGVDRFATATAVADRFFDDVETIGVATGRRFEDALSGSAHIARRGGPLLLTEPTSVPSALREFLIENRSTITDLVIYGGTAAVAQTTADEIEELLEG